MPGGQQTILPGLSRGRKEAELAPGIGLELPGLRLAHRTHHTYRSFDDANQRELPTILATTAGLDSNLPAVMEERGYTLENAIVHTRDFEMK